MSAAVLADGLCAATAEIVYQVPRGKQVRVEQVHCFNPEASSEIVQLVINVSGTERTWAQVTLTEHETVDFLDVPLRLDENDALLLRSSTGSQVVYLVYGEPA